MYKESFVSKRVIHTVDKKQVLLVLPFSVVYLLRIGPAQKNVLKITFLVVHEKVVYQSRHRIPNVCI